MEKCKDCKCSYAQKNFNMCPFCYVAENKVNIDNEREKEQTQLFEEKLDFIEKQQQELIEEKNLLIKNRAEHLRKLYKFVYHVYGESNHDMMDSQWINYISKENAKRKEEEWSKIYKTSISIMETEQLLDDSMVNLGCENT